MKDPLAGQRQPINEGRSYSLLWPDRTGKDLYPVKVGDVFPLRSCDIEITKIHRVRRNGERLMRAEFNRYPHHKPEYLARRGGLTPDRDRAMASQDDEDPGTLRVIRDGERSPKAAAEHAALGREPEPEAVPKHEIDDYEGSREARQRYELQMAERRIAEADAPLEDRLARLREMAQHRNIDISGDMRVIERRVAAAEEKVLERAAA